MRTADDLVRVEVHYCVSSLVATLASQYGLVTHVDANGRSTDLAILIDQAFELASPIDDWEEAAQEAGFAQVGSTWFSSTAMYDTAESACADWDIEPYQWEVFEHWIVSDWLADQLAAKGEKVDKDFAGLTVWARTTTGQAIAMDSVIQAITADLAKG